MTNLPELPMETLNQEQQQLLAAYPNIPPSMYYLLGYFLFFMG